MKNLLVLHGPNLNLLGLHEPSIYGHASLEELNIGLQNHAHAAGWFLSAKQTNSEAEFIDAIHQAHQQQVDYLLLNPAAFTHTSIAIRDALLAVNIPFVEVHLNNIYAREPFRKHSYMSDLAQGVICGLGTKSYFLGLQFIIEEFK